MDMDNWVYIMCFLNFEKVIVIFFFSCYLLEEGRILVC